MDSNEVAARDTAKVHKNLEDCLFTMFTMQFTMLLRRLGWHFVLQLCKDSVKKF